MAEADEGYEMVAPGVEAPGPDVETAADAGGNAAATPAVPVVPLGRTWALDFAEQRFIPGTAGGPLAIRGLDTLGQWIEKCLRTSRGGALACDPQFGVDVMPAEVFDGGAFDEDAAADAVEDWRTALEQHPRIVSVEDMRLIGDESVDFAILTMRVLVEGLDEGVDVTTRVGPDGLAGNE